MRLNGQIIQSYFVCKKQTWFLLNYVSMSHESDLIIKGRLINEKSFSREKKNIIVDDIVIDFRKENDGKLVVFEIKKSQKIINAARWQLLFYLLYLKERGIDASGVLVFPREKKRENLYLTPEIEKKFRRIFYEMGKISRLKNPPRAERKRYCKKCSYYDLCWV